MAYTGGDILEITYNHPTVGAGTIYCKSNESGTIDPGGYRSEDDANLVTGAGELIDQMNRVRSSFETPPIAWDMTDRDEIVNLADMAASPVLGDWTINHLNGKVWAGKGKPVGDINGDTNTALITLKLAFTNKLKPIT